VPNFTTTSSSLLRVQRKQVIDTPTYVDDSLVLASQRYDRNRSNKIDKCYALHGRPPRSVVAVHFDPSPQSAIVDPASSNTAGHSTIFNDFLKWYEERQSSNSTTSTSIACTSTSFVGMTHSDYLGPWVLESGTTNHITSNKSLFSSLSCLDNLPSVTMADGFRISSHGVGTVNTFPSISIAHVL